MKTFLSIGSGPGMGLATAERFAKEGFQIILSARNAAKTQELAEQLKVKGYTVAMRNLDASDPSSVASLVSKAENEFGAIDVLHYNAASMRKATILEQPRDTFNTDLAVNIGGALVAAQAAIPKMSERGSGSILLTGGGYSLKPNPEHLSQHRQGRNSRPGVRSLRELESKGPTSLLSLSRLSFRRARRMPRRSPSTFGICTISREARGHRK